MVCKIAWQDGLACATARREPRSLPGTGFAHAVGRATRRCAPYTHFMTQ